MGGSRQTWRWRRSQLTEIIKRATVSTWSNPLKSTVTIIALIALVAGIWAGYLRYFEGYVWYKGLGFDGKTFWDLMGLLIIPIVLALGAYFFNRSEKRNELKIAADRQQDMVLQNYLDKMADLLLKERLLEKKDNSEDPTVDVAKVRTVTTIRMLDENRRNILIQFLLDAKLYDFILVEASLGSSDLQGIVLGEANLQGANLVEANLQGAFLAKADLRYALLHRANLRRAFLGNANLLEAYLEGADLRNAHLPRAILDGAHMEGSHLEKSRLINTNLRGAFLGPPEPQIDLPGFFKNGVNLKGADLTKADLQGADLQKTNLQGAFLFEANLTYTDLTGARLNGANLDRAILLHARVTAEQLAQAKSLKGATMPDGTRHD